MKKILNLLVALGIVLAVYAVILKFSGGLFINLGFLKTAPLSALVLAIFLILVAIFIGLSSKKDVFIKRNVKILFWSSYITIMALVSFFIIASSHKLSDGQVIERFKQVYFTNFHRIPTTYLGIISRQFPTDNWVMQEIISEIKPDFIIETGTYYGGTTLFYATILEKVNEKGKVITLDIAPHDPKVLDFRIWKERVEFIQADCVSKEAIDRIAKEVQGHTVMVTLDSMHSKEHVLKELNLYSGFVSLNSYIVVQDTTLGHPVACEYKEGPWEAVEEFLKTNHNFQIDHSWEKHLITNYPSGFLKRIK